MLYKIAPIHRISTAFYVLPLRSMNVGYIFCRHMLILGPFDGVRLKVVPIGSGPSDRTIVLDFTCLETEGSLLHASARTRISVE